ncbi:GNAT family N-acetyltransferase [Catellatospora sp. KI3]|uniref:GNAT family N-acetyltransferase n=1 Tax=Catellatospora sp. KI3 TaxID=3041620 RepID=UPI002482F407|nr:GNAT family N-acetyltransferase [Catellatospora sp. KI3]MDI1465775.1 GNAT family N-acetyltransferase [Catellatospora sp. KI3]
MVTYRTAEPQDWAAILRTVRRTFLNEDDQGTPVDEALFEPARAVVALDGPDVVAHAGTYSRELSVPGGAVPAGFVTAVVVAGTHRRRGVASTMLTRQLEEIRDHGDPLAVLWASEAGIYRRFGYGQASHRIGFTIDRREVQVVGAGKHTLSLRVGTPAELRAELGTVYERVRPTRPGYASRDDRWWTWRLHDDPGHRSGAGPLLALVCRDGDAVLGYALHRTRSEWDNLGPKGEVNVMEVVTDSPAAYAAMWDHLLNVDLTRQVSYWLAAVDEPLLHIASDTRRLGGRYGDGLWARLLDIPAALSARRYAAPVDVVLEVEDTVLPGTGGRFRLAGSLDGAACVRTDDAPDLRLDVATLGTVYLGGNSLGSLAAAGRVEELTSGALAAADPAFRWHRAPVSIEIF